MQYPSAVCKNGNGLTNRNKLLVSCVFIIAYTCDGWHPVENYPTRLNFSTGNNLYRKLSIIIDRLYKWRDNSLVRQLPSRAIFVLKASNFAQIRNNYCSATVCSMCTAFQLKQKVPHYNIAEKKPIVPRCIEYRAACYNVGYSRRGNFDGSLVHYLVL